MRRILLIALPLIVILAVSCNESTGTGGEIIDYTPEAPEDRYGLEAVLEEPARVVTPAQR